MRSIPPLASRPRSAFAVLAALAAAVALGCAAPGDEPSPPEGPTAGAAAGAAAEADAGTTPPAGAGKPALPLPPVALDESVASAPPAPPIDGLQTTVDAGLAALRSGNLDDALARFNAAAALAPDDARVQRLIGNVHARRGDLEEALASLERSLRLDDTVAGTHYEAAQVAFNLRNMVLAEALARRSVELGPDNPRAAELLATVLHRRQDFAGMIEVMEPRVAAGTDRAQTRYLLGLAYFGEGRLEDARTQLREAIRLDPNHVLAHRDLAATLKRLGDAEGAARSQRTFESLTGRTD